MLGPLIHISAAYSNAVLVALLPHISDFVRTLDLPISTPITTNQVALCRILPYQGPLDAGIWLTNGFSFVFDNDGFVGKFSYPSNIFITVDTSSKVEVDGWRGALNMTKSEAFDFGRATIKKLGYKLEWFDAQKPPGFVDGGPLLTQDKKILPYCNLRWNYHDDDTLQMFEIQIDMQRKSVLGLSVYFPGSFCESNHIGTPVTSDVVPELESDYRKRTQGTMVIRTNAPPHLPAADAPPGTNAPAQR